jgi:hypothetical protein
MSYKVYTHSLEFIDVPYDETLQKEVETLIHKIHSRSGDFHVKYDLEVEWNGSDAETKLKNVLGLNADEEGFLNKIEEHCHDAVRASGKGKIKNEAEVEREA